MSVTIYAPASIGNVSVGFDLLGAAITPIKGEYLGDRVKVEAAKKGISLNISGAWASALPSKKEENIVYQCAEFFLNHLDEKNGLALFLEKNLPIGSGLGSSASSIVAALTALNEFFDKPFGSYELLKLMGIFEARLAGAIHYDNVAPSYSGGIQLIIDSPKVISQSIPHFQAWYWVVAYPGMFLSTNHMRSLIPTEFNREVTLKFGHNLSAFVHASYKQDAKLAISLLKDVIAEPYRAKEIPNFLSAKKALQDLGMLATGISGSGPTLFSLTDSLATAEQAKNYLDSHFVDAKKGFSHICQLDTQGARQAN